MASSPSPPKPVDPNTIIQAQEQANRVNRVTPFGSQTYDAQGNLTTTLPQGTQTAFNNVSNMAGNQQQLINTPSGAGGLQNAILNKIASRYSSPSSQKGGQMQMPPMMGSGQPSPQAWNAALGQIWGNPGSSPVQGGPMQGIPMNGGNPLPPASTLPLQSS